jgi:hypothetical protein
MKTDDLISMLSTGIAPVDPRLLAKRLSIALIAGALGATLLTALLLGVRPDLAQVSATPLFWAKIAFPLLMLIGAVAVTSRLARPGVAPGGGRWVIALTVAVIWLWGAYVVVYAPPDLQLAAILGKTWRVCPFNIAMLSVPAFVAVFWALRELAPTRPALAGASAGLMSGAVAALAYCLHCPEMGVAFWGVWYLLGMLVPTVVGALLGPQLLCW